MVAPSSYPQTSSFTNSMIAPLTLPLVTETSTTETVVDSTINDFYGTVPTSLFVPAASTATSIKFNVAYNESDTPAPLYVDGAIYTLTVRASTAAYYNLDRQNFRGYRFVQLVLNTAQESNINFLVMPTLMN